ncbi:MAG TPA: acyl-CoA dehydrogenase family protein, partial [Amycolatopsis sp.]|nr:acyl-CoA dehydrogenase family protein [Amycolatopsis sp.]
MRFDLDDRETAWRDEVRRFVREAADPAWMNRWATNYERSGTPEGVAWRKALGARNWLCLGWPPEYGGLGRSFMDQWILHDEVSRTGLPKLGIGVNMIAHTLMRVADDAMKAEWLPRIA